MIGTPIPLSKICSNISRRFIPPENQQVWFINTGDVLNGKFLHKDLSDWSTLPGQAKKAVEVDDIIYSEIRPGNGRFAFIEQEEAGAVVSTKFMVIKAAEGVHPRFLYHCLTSSKMQSEMKRIAESRSGTFPQITFESIDHLEILLPEINEQRVISIFLDFLQDKIEQNKKINFTLEEIEKAIFKSWFINFDPVKSKAAGHSTGLPSEINDLFPDSFQDSEIGPIPNNWGFIYLKDSILSIKDRQKDKKLDEFSATISGIKPRAQKFKKTLSKSSANNRIAIEGDLIFGLSRKVLNFGRMNYPIGGFSSVYEVFRSKSDENISTQIIEKYIRLRMPLFMDILKPAAREGQTIDRAILLEKKIPKFPPKLINYFQSKINHINSKIVMNQEQIITLENISNALLPKLISGELRIPDAEKIIEVVGI